MSNRNRLICLFIVWLSGIFINSKGQEPYDQSKVIPPSPTAASLGVYGDLNVSYYTGSPDINIPLYQIKIGDISIPIRMQYNASGIRVSENASWVGLGWSLSSGGVITRTIKGGDDFGSNGYYYADALPNPYNNPLSPYDKNYFDAILHNSKDAEPDVYSYNFGEYSGRFVMGKVADGSNVFIANRNNFKVEYIQATAKWIITTADGYKFYFGRQERVTDYYYSDPYTEINDYAALSSFNYEPKPDAITAWYLDEIVSPASETISFQYEIKSTSLSLVSKSETEYNLLYATTDCIGNIPSFPGTIKSFNASKQIIQDVYLTKIIFNQGTIEFNTSDRDDLEYTNSSKPKKLSEILIKDISGNLIKKYSFTYSYFNNSSAFDKRLKLDNLTEFAADGSSKPPYTFTYFDPNGLPPKYTKSIDHWGFYNGKSNQGLLPSQLVLSGGGILPTGDSKYFPGADRVPDGQDATLKKGILSSITYPTGGSSQFDYEVNEYRNPSGDDRYLYTPMSTNVIAYPGNESSQATTSFDLTTETYVTFAYNYLPFNENAASLDGVQTVYAYVYKQGQSGPVVSFSNWSCPGQPDPTCGSGDPGDEYYSTLLSAGHYTISVTYLQNYFTSLAASWQDKVAVTQRKGGGLRIKSLINYTGGTSKASERRFIYEENGNTTGLLIAQPKYDFYSMVTINPGMVCNHYVSYLGRMSNSIQSNGFTSQGAIVGYDKVIELIGENGEGGKTEYYFVNIEDQIADENFPFTPNISNPLNGKLLVSVVKDAAGQQLKKIDYIYETKSSTTLKGVKVFQPTPASLYSSGVEETYKVKFYDNKSEWSVLTSEKETLYSTAGNIVSEKKYFYDNFEHLEMTKQEFTRSDGKTLVTKYKYPGDYPAAGSSSFVKQMKERNIISPVIEEQTILKEGVSQKLVSGKFTEYGFFNNSFYKPAIIHNLFISAPSTDLTESNISSTNQISLHPGYKPQVYFDKYGSSGGNLEVFHKADNKSQAYIWDYKNELPIAEVANAPDNTFAYTSFESDGKGNWSFSGAATNDNTAPTGTKCYILSNGNISKSGLSTSGIYIVSYWSKNGPQTVSGTNITSTGRSIGSWTYYEHSVSNPSGGTITVSGSGTIDELRLYPKGSLMTTYTYKPLIGITSQCDANNRITYYEYDGFGRLSLIRDQNNKILKKFCYNYAGQAENCN